jgi:hypothetical protein
MTEGHKTSWLHNAMLLASLAAGVCATQIMPAYHQHVGTVTYPSRAAASRNEAPSEESRGFSQGETHGPKLTLVRNID